MCVNAWLLDIIAMIILWKQPKNAQPIGYLLWSFNRDGITVLYMYYFVSYVYVYYCESLKKNFGSGPLIHIFYTFHWILTKHLFVSSSCSLWWPIEQLLIWTTFQYRAHSRDIKQNQYIHIIIISSIAFYTIK